MDTNKEDFDISRLKRFLWDSPNRIHNLIVTTLSILTLGMVFTIGFAMAQPKGFVQSFSETFSNIMGPVVGAAAALFALLAFYVQYRANQIIIERQRIDDESRLFELYLREFRLSVSKWQILDSVKGEMCSQFWISEFNAIKKILIVVEYEVLIRLKESLERDNDHFFHDLAFLVMIESRFALRQAGSWSDNPCKSEVFKSMVDDTDILFHRLAALTSKLEKGEYQEFVLNYDGIVNKKITIEAAHPFFRTFGSSMRNSFMLLDSMIQLCLTHKHPSNSLKIGERRVLAGFLHGSIGYLYLLYHESRYGNPEIRDFVQTIMSKSFSDLDSSRSLNQ